ncbi:unnamed protein product [Brassicogethes aeneus]|uniref:Regulatory protein zeste n=1 Tax=Brassicogethes aeneus TaxID=1431903 RepID=A0A9P0BIQ7_BRAAE|nr:unnamed protein product [Brassicogethes aeneus]
MESEKRKRGANFTQTERRHLLTVVNRYKHIIENKKTDAVTWKEKESTWKKIEVEFNSTTEGIPRSDKQLKLKYEAVKKELKKNFSSHKKYVLGTGGGRHVPEPAVQTEEENELFHTIAISASGLESRFDSDALAGISGIPVREVVSTPKDSNPIDQFREVEWDEPSAGFLQTKVHPALRIDAQASAINNNTTEILQEIIVDPDLNILLDDTQTSARNMEHEGKENVANKKSWASRRRPVISKKKSMSSASAKFELLAEKKIELVEEQLKIAKESIKHNELEHNLKVENLELEKKILIKKLQKMDENFNEFD